MLKSLIALVLCFASASAFAIEKSALVVKTYTDYTNSHQSEDKEMTFVVDSQFAKKYYLEFYMFRNGEDQVCFTGDVRQANEVVQTILNASTGDAYVYPNKPKLTKDLIKQTVQYQDESGDNEFDFEVARCK